MANKDLILRFGEKWYHGGDTELLREVLQRKFGAKYSRKRKVMYVKKERWEEAQKYIDSSQLLKDSKEFKKTHVLLKNSSFDYREIFDYGDSFHNPYEYADRFSDYMKPERYEELKDEIKEVDSELDRKRQEKEEQESAERELERLKRQEERKKIKAEWEELREEQLKKLKSLDRDDIPYYDQSFIEECLKLYIRNRVIHADKVHKWISIREKYSDYFKIKNYPYDLRNRNVKKKYMEYYNKFKEFM